MTDPFFSVSPCSHSQPRRDRRPQCLADHHYVIEKGEMIWRAETAAEKLPSRP
jgi:hypothetical protein